jgi:hypothetical protein
MHLVPEPDDGTGIRSVHGCLFVRVVPSAAPESGA